MGHPLSFTSSAPPLQITQVQGEVLQDGTVMSPPRNYLPRLHTVSSPTPLDKLAPATLLPLNKVEEEDPEPTSAASTPPKPPPRRKPSGGAAANNAFRRLSASTGAIRHSRSAEWSGASTRALSHSARLPENAGLDKSPSRKKLRRRSSGGSGSFGRRRSSLGRRLSGSSRQGSGGMPAGLVPSPPAHARDPPPEFGALEESLLLPPRPDAEAETLLDPEGQPLAPKQRLTPKKPRRSNSSAV